MCIASVCSRPVSVANQDESDPAFSPEGSFGVFSSTDLEAHSLLGYIGYGGVLKTAQEYSEEVDKDPLNEQVSTDPIRHTC